MFFNYDPSLSILPNSVGVKTKPLIKSTSLIKTTSSQNVNSVDSESDFPDLIDVNSVDFDSNFSNLVDSASDFPDLVDVNSVDSASDFPDLIYSASKEFFDITKDEVLYSYLVNPLNNVTEIITMGQHKYFLVTNTEFLQIDTIYWLLKCIYISAIYH